MAAASYTTNLQTMSPLNTTTGVTAVGAGGSITAETDFYIQNGLCVSKATAAQWRNSSRGGVLYNNGTGITLPTDGAVLFWIYWWGPGVLGTKAGGGAELNVGSATTAYRSWYVTGSDDWEFGGWRNYPLNPDVATDRADTGSPTATLQYFGWQALVTASTSIGKGNPYGIDAIRYGRCDLICTNGDLANGYATFLGAANWNNEGTLRYGLLIPRDGAYYLQGLFQFGTATTPVDFRDSNKPIFIQNTEKVTTNFNTFEVVNTSSNVELDSISVTSLGTISRGRWLTTNNATVSITSCNFIDLNTFEFLSNTTATGTTFRRCGQITLGGATLSNCDIVRSFAATSLLAGSDLSTIDNIRFIKATTTNHAIEIIGGTSHTLNNITFTGYLVGTAGTNVTTTSTGNEAVFVNVGSGTVTLNITGGTIPSVRSSGAQVNVVSTANVTLTGLQAGSEVRAYVGTDPATSVEIAGTESSSTTFTFGQSFSGQQGYITIIAFGYNAVYLSITYGSLDVEIPIQQTVDRVYSNPSQP